ncbi:MAG: hypothetical protein ABI192_13030 [Bradyrhizobium sp.]
MSDGTYCVIRDLGLVKGGKGMRHHEVLMTFSLKALLKRIRQRRFPSFHSFARHTGSPESPRMIGADALNELPATKS